MSDPQSIAAGYMESWNATDASQRSLLLGRWWTDDATYADPLMQGAGRDQIDGLITAVQERFPGLRFALRGPADAHGAHLRFSWQLGPEDGESLVEGTDFAIIDGGRLKSVVGFLDKVPAGA